MSPVSGFGLTGTADFQASSARDSYLLSAGNATFARSISYKKMNQYILNMLIYISPLQQTTQNYKTIICVFLTLLIKGYHAKEL